MRRSTLRSPLLAACCLALSIAPAALWAKEILYVHNTRSGEISKIAIPEHEVVGEIRIGRYMDYLAASPDGRVLYVNRIEPLEPDRGAIGVSGELIAVSTLTDDILWRVPIDGMTHHMSVSKDGRLVFVPLYDTWWIAVVDTGTRKVVKKIFFGHGGHGSKLSADGRHLYVGSMMNDFLGVIDTEKLEMVGRVGFPEGVRPFAITRDESRAYVQLSRTHGFAVVDPRERKVLSMVPMPTLGEQVQGDEMYPHNVNHGIALTPDEKLLFANGSAIDVVSVFTHPALEHVKSIPVGRDPNSIAFSLDGRFAYVTNRGEDTLSILDVEKLAEVKRLELGDYPLRMVVIDVPSE